MKNEQHLNGTPGDRGTEGALAHWLYQLLAAPPPGVRFASPHEEGDQPDAYHRRFFQQLPELVLAVLQGDPQALARYAPLLFHLVGCATCHSAYLDVYDALWEAVHAPGDVAAQQGTGRSTLRATSPGMVAYVCQVLLSEAKAVLDETRRERTDGSTLARSYLQRALRMSAQLTQDRRRVQVVHELGEVAMLYERPHASPEPSAVAYSSAPLLPRGSGEREGTTLQCAAGTSRPATQPVILIHADSRMGAITQREETLELHLEDLDAPLRGSLLTISLPLGTLLDEVRWHGGNSRAIQSVTPVDDRGTMRTPRADGALPG